MCLGRHAVLCACLAAGCSKNEVLEPIATTIEGCKEQFASGKGYGYSVDRHAIATMPSTTVGGVGGSQSAPIASESPLERALFECEHGAAGSTAGASNVAASNGDRKSESSSPIGSNCEYPKLMTHDAALCVAAVHGLKEARGYAATIVYRSEYGRIAWAVNNTLELADGVEGGEIVTFDATTGEVFERVTWSDSSAP